jgi:hypothetical protein
MTGEEGGIVWVEVQSLVALQCMVDRMPIRKINQFAETLMCITRHSKATNRDKFLFDTHHFDESAGGGEAGVHVRAGLVEVAKDRVISKIRNLKTCI